jgi:hypothetical protein
VKQVPSLNPVLLSGEVYELRVLKTRQGTASGYFNDPALLYKAAAELDGKVPGLYFTLNPVNPALLARAKNRIQFHAKATTSDVDIVRRSWLLIDCDAIRPAEISSSDAEHQAALDRAESVASWLSEQGWPEPVKAGSGNGAHLLYRIDLPNDQHSTAMIKAVLEVLALKFNDAIVMIDTGVFNAARITKLYGTMAGKGDSTDDRPHRRSAILSCPDPIRVVQVEQLQALAVLRPVEPPRVHNGAYQNGIDARAFLQRYGIQVSREKPWQNGATVFELEKCPFNPEHQRSSSIIQFATGAIAFRCFHNSCQPHRWQDLREKLEPGRTSTWNVNHPVLSQPALVLTPASGVRPTKVLWALNRRIPLRAVTVVAGRPGLGKSTAVGDWAAQWSCGTLDGDLYGRPSAVVIASAEDSKETTIVPRLMAAKADLSLIHFPAIARSGLDGGLLIPEDLRTLESAMQATGSRILVIDPLMAHLPGTINSHRDQDIRRALAPLAEFADALQAAVIVVVHLNKDHTKEALDRVGGSTGIVAAARSVLIVARDPEEPDGVARLCAHLKCNLGVEQPTLRFNLESRRVLVGSEQIDTSGVVWLGEVEGLRADDLLAAPDRSQRQERLDATGWLREALSDGERPADLLYKEGEQMGFSRNVLWKAKGHLHVKARKAGFGATGGWYWRLPETDGPISPGTANLRHTNQPKPATEPNISLRSSSANLSDLSAPKIVSKILGDDLKDLRHISTTYNNTTPKIFTRADIGAPEEVDLAD